MLPSPLTRLCVRAVLALTLLAPLSAAMAHAERQSFFPANRGSTIYVLPGFYKEQPSIRSFENDFGAAKPEDKPFCQAIVQSGRGKLS